VTKPGTRVKAVEVVPTIDNVKTVHVATKTTVLTARQADGLEMTDLDPEAAALFHRDEMTDLDLAAAVHQDEMTDLDPDIQDEITDLDLNLIEITDLYPRTSPILNTSRGKCTAPWSKYVLEVLRLSRLLDVARLLVEHLQKLQGHHHVQR
jgi:hypothetical protein